MYVINDKQKNIDLFVKNMLNRSTKIFKYENLPKTLPPFEIEKLIQTKGKAVFAKVENDIFVFDGGYTGNDVYGRPTEIIITNPYLPYNDTLTINKDCVLIKNDDSQNGLIWLFEKYGIQLIETDITLQVSNWNKRIQTLLSASDDVTKESAIAYLEKIKDGELGVIGESMLFDSLKVQNKNIGGGNSLTDIIELQQYLKANLYNEIGLSASYNMKRERLNTSEVNLDNDILKPLIINMFENRLNSIELLNEMFGLNVVVSLNSPWLEMMEPNEPVTEVDEPVTEIDESVTEIDEPVTEVDEPVTEIDEPVTEPNEPVTDDEDGEENGN